MAAEDVDDVEQVFRKFDRNSSGDIDPKELTLALSELGIEVSNSVATKVLQGYDTDRSAGLELDEFRKVVAELRAYQAKHQPAAAPAQPIADDIEETFRRYDTNSSGDIDPKELSKMLRELGLDVGTAEATKVLQKFDDDKSGKLQMDEFRKLVTELRNFAAQQAAEVPAAGEADKANEKPRIAALAKVVPKKNYLPRFRVRKADDGKTGSFLEFMTKRQATIAKDIAAEKAKKRSRRRGKIVEKGNDDDGMDEEEREAWMSLMFTIALTALLALSEAFDIDVLVGFALMPFISVMKWLAHEFENDHLDPTIWASKISTGSVNFAQNHPLGFVVVDFGLFGILVAYYLFEADLKKWWATRGLRQQGYDSLEDDEEAGFGGGFLSKVAQDPDEVQLLLRQASEDLEEHDLIVRLKSNAEADVIAEMKAHRAKLENRIKTYNDFLSALETEKAEAVDLEELARQEAEAEAKKKREGGCAAHTKLAVTILKNTISGAITVWLYFMDLISDYQVTMLFYNAEAYSFAFVSACLLVGQFLVVWLRVLPYLYDTYGPESTFYRAFLWGGMPCGMFGLDFLMLLEPFGLLPIVPLPENLKQFVPAYKATRIIAEVLIEALPQCAMQAVILVMVSMKVRAGTATKVEKNLMAVNKGTFTTTLPKSILLSTLSMLKTWYELVQEAREAGISVFKKGQQLWNVGYGLPLDAIKSGSIYGWKCQYEISDNEIVSLVDALGKNESLTRLDLSLAGFEWMPPVEREERSALTTLLTVMNGDSKALENLEKMIICPKTRWEVPVGALRSGPETAIKTLGEAPFLSKGGPERKEMHTMFELLCKNRNPEPSKQELDLSYAAVTKIFNDSQKKGAKKPAKRAAWQTNVAQLMAKGMTRRAHFKVVVGAEVLRNIGFGAQELLSLAFSPEELKAGGFEAKELKEAGFKAFDLKELGYKPKDLWEAEIPVTEMKGLGYSAKELKDGGYTAQQMKDANCFTLVELKAGRYKAADLGEAGYRIADLRAAKFTALDLRKAMIFQVGMMREAGYTAPEMKKAGYDAERVNAAGYDAIEATNAGYTVPQMHAAGYSALNLRKAGHTALVLREAGYVLNDLQGAGYIASELEEAGYTAQELKEAGTSLVQLKAAGTPVATLKDAGYTAQRLKQQGYTAEELAHGSRGRVDIRSLKVGSDEGGYTAKELKAGGITAQELRKGKVFFRIEEYKDGGWSTRELRDGGYSAGELRACGYSAADLSKVGYSTADLVTGGYHPKDLRAIGAPAGELREAGLSAKALSDVGYSAKELLVGGFEAKELIACGFGVGELCEAGFTATDLRALGFTAKELKAYGYGAKALKEAGSVVKELKELGFSDSELEDAGFTRRAVEAVDGRSVRQLKDEGNYEVTELREYGYIVADLRGIYSVKQMKDQGFSLEEIRAGGVPNHAVQAVDGRSTSQLRSHGYPARILRKVGFELYDIVDGGYTASELKSANYTAAELKEMGFLAGALRVAGFTSRQLKTARYTLREMQEGGFEWKDMVIFLRATFVELTEAGYRGLDSKHRLFLEYRQVDEDEDGTTIHDLSVLSPRYHATLSPRELASMNVGDNPLVMREGHELASDKICDVPPGMPVEVLEQRKGDGAQVRARIRFISRNWFTKGIREGWVTSVQADGKQLLVTTTLVAQRLPPPNFQDMPKPNLEDLEA